MTSERIFAIPADRLMADRPASGVPPTPTEAPSAHDGWKQLIPVPDGVALPTITNIPSYGDTKIPLAGNEGQEDFPTYVRRGASGPRDPAHVSANVNVYIYRDSSGRVLGYVSRFSYGDGRKEFRPHTYGEWPDGRGDWRPRGFPLPRPIYGLDQLALRPDAPVLIVEGEKAADAASGLFPRYVAITSPHGARSADKADWSCLAGREVVIWPDNDNDGRQYATAVAHLATSARAARVSVVKVPREFPPKWDLADTLPDGWP